MKIVERILVYNNDDSNLKENYRPLSVLPTVPKVYKRVMKYPISSYSMRYFRTPYVVLELDINPTCFDKVAGKMEEISGEIRSGIGNSDGFVRSI